jgi:hypothetical protein
MQAARCIWEVTAGLLLGQPDPEHTRRWVLTGQQADSPDAARLWQQHMDEAFGYARGLADPDRLNWVRVDWAWL